MKKKEMPTKIEVRRARVRNLKNVDVDIPLNGIVGTAGVSNSGKSSLALGVLYAEGSQRYVKTGVFEKGASRIIAIRRSCMNRRIMRAFMQQHRRKLLLCLCRHLKLFQRWNAIFIAKRFSNQWNMIVHISKTNRLMVERKSQYARHL